MHFVNGIVGKGWVDGEIPICDEDWLVLHRMRNKPTYYSEDKVDYDDELPGIFVDLETGEVVGIRLDYQTEPQQLRILTDLKSLKHIWIANIENEDHSYVFPESFSDLTNLISLKIFEDHPVARFVLPDCDPLPNLRIFYSPSHVDEWIVPDWFDNRFLQK